MANWRMTLELERRISFEGVDAVLLPFPAAVLAANGIYRKALRDNVLVMRCVHCRCTWNDPLEDNPVAQANHGPLDQMCNMIAAGAQNAIGPAQNQPVENVNNGEPQGANPNADGERLRMACVICLSKEPEMLFLPCGHAVTCQECHATLQQYTDLCPVCRACVRSYIRFCLA